MSGPWRTPPGRRAAAPPLADPTTIDSPGGAAALIQASTAQIDESIKVWSANVAKEPRDFISATTLSSLYYSRGRLTGDLADEQKALQFAQTAVSVAPTEAGGPSDGSRDPLLPARFHRRPVQGRRALQ